MFRLSFILCSKVRFSTGIVKNLFKDSQLVDNIKININELNPAILEANPLLIFEQRNISNEGLLFPVLDKNKEHAKDKNGNLLFKTTYKNAFYNGLEFKIFDTGLITISGSLHKYWNKGAQNYNDFNFEAFLWVLNDIKHKFSITPEQCILKCLEIGINIVPPIPTNQFLNYCFLHKTKPFEKPFNSLEGKYSQVRHSQYIIKIYNKALHYKSKGFDIKGEIMRFEIKYTKMQKLNERGIYNLQDLANYGLHNFKDELLNEFNNILFYDNTIQTQSRSISNYKDANYWNDLLSSKRNDLFNYHRKHLKKLTAQSSQKIQFQTSEIMSNKIDFLNSNTTQIDTLTILSKRVVLHNQITTKNILCQVTKINISMQKNDSILLSHTGLKYYYKTDRKVFEQIKRQYLTEKWIKSDFETQIIKIAHNIRNAKGTRKTKQVRIYPNQQINLLPNLGF